jgi:hypothetical protein
MNRSKKSMVWISAILYVALAVSLITIVLTAGMPVLDRLRDKNVVLQTKELMFALNDNIRTVFREGAGSQRPLTIQIGKGDFEIDYSNDEIKWTFKTKSILSELNTPVYEGDLKIETQTTNVEKEYNVILTLNYEDPLDLVYESGSTTEQNLKISGKYNLIVKNLGQSDSGEIQIQIKEVTT